MNYDKNKYEELIDSSPLFSLSREKERTAYRREALKMVEYLYCYLMAVSAYKYEAYAVEIVDTANRCIEKYNSSAGRFLNYFTAAWKKNYRHLIGKESVKEDFKGIHFTEEEERNYRKYKRLAQTMGIDTKSIEFDERIAEAMGISASKAAALQKMINCKPILYSGMNEETEKNNSVIGWDGKKSLDEELSQYTTDGGILQDEARKEFLNLLESTYNQLQERQKQMFAMLITSKLAFSVCDDDELMSFIRQKTFFDESVFEESLQRGEQIQAKEIAKRFGVVEASVSRSWKTFKDKLKSGDRRDWK